MSETTESKSPVTPAVSTLSEFHEPRLFVQPRCIEKCRVLAAVAAGATLKAAQDPEWQVDVTCVGRRPVLGCGADTYTTGSYSTFGQRIPESDEFFLQNPALFEGGKYSGVDEAVQDAIDHGAEVYGLHDLQ